jgi:hypothetical protein
MMTMIKSKGAFLDKKAESLMKLLMNLKDYNVDYINYYDDILRRLESLIIPSTKLLDETLYSKSTFSRKMR